MKKGKDVILGGVCSGFADYFNVDTTIMRVIWVILACCTIIPMSLVYIICLLIMEKSD